MSAIAPTPQRLKAVLRAMRRDSMIDEYFWGDVDRISPEAPVPVVTVQSVSRRLGGAANVVQNLAKLGVSPCIVSVCGNDDNGRVLSTMLTETGCATEGLYASGERPTTIKTRIIARNQQVVRADRELIRDLDDAESAALLAAFGRLCERADGAIISDYGKGVVSPGLVTAILGNCVSKGKFVAVDPKERHTHLYKGASVITPNLREAHMLLGYPQRACSDGEIEALGWRIVESYRLPYLLITLSERGMALFCREERTFDLLPTAARKVFDVTGAGDTVISVFTAAMSCGATPLEAADLANHAAGLTVAELGTASAGADEILASYGHGTP